VAAYLDWAALRPMTDMEYEKACRGTESVLAFSYANNFTDGIDVVSLSNAAQANELGNPGIGTGGMLNLSSTFNAPLRNGFAATPTSNRVTVLEASLLGNISR
jgi:hypothetical protein